MRKFIHCIVLVVSLSPLSGALAQEAGLYNRPVLVLDPGHHVAPIRRADVDAAGRYAVTGSYDKTVRVWSLVDDTLERVIRMPVGPGDVGKVYAVALSPDGQTIAAGGWMRTGDQHIYLFNRKDGAMIQRLDGQPNVINHLAFAPNGKRLAASLGGGNGIRVYDKAVDGTWDLAWSDQDYGDRSNGVAFGPGGRVATTSYDGKLRLYTADGTLLNSIEADLPEPFSLAFHPMDGRIAVGFSGSTELRIYDGETLEKLPAPDTSDLDFGDISEVSWSADGSTLYAGGRYDDGGGSPVLAWGHGGMGSRQVLSAGDNTVMSLKPMPDGAVLAASADPWLGVIAADGSMRWQMVPETFDPRGQMSNFAVSEDGMVVEFGPEYWGETDRRRFDIAALKMLPPDQDGRVHPPDQDSLLVENWEDRRTPSLNGAILLLEPYEFSRSLAIHPDGARFVLGADWTLRMFDQDGTELWARPGPSVAWAVNISGDGRFVIAAYGDGTIRWHRMEDGIELLALFPYPDGENWVVWEPEGRYASTLRARHALRWVVNLGWDQVPQVLEAGDIRDSFVPDVIRRVLPLGGTPDAVHAANQAKRIEDFRKLTGGFAPGAQLHVLSVGIADYGEKATQINLNWADDDAADIAAALKGQGDWPYRQGHQVTLRDEEATAVTILDQLDAIARRMASAPDGNDIAVIAFSGHGVVIGEEYYLLPHGVDIATPNRLSRSAISGTELQTKIMTLSKVGRVLLLLDTCSSGAATGAGQSLGTPHGVLQKLARRNVTVLASSDATQVSRESSEWENGAFTEAVLEAFQEGDDDGNGMLSIGELTDYVGRRLHAMTSGLQTPTIETRFTGDIFASGM